MIEQYKVWAESNIVNFNFIVFLIGMFCIWLCGCWVYELVQEFKIWLDSDDE